MAWRDQRIIYLGRNIHVIKILLAGRRTTGLLRHQHTELQKMVLINNGSDFQVPTLPNPKMAKIFLHQRPQIGK